MLLRKFIVGLFFSFTLAFAGACLADTYLTIANNTGDTLVINNTHFLRPQQATWSPLDVSIKRRGVFNIVISDTGQRCGNGWIIRTAGYYNGRYVKSDYCIHLRFLEVGCMAVLVDNGGLQMNKTRGTHCSDTWWRNNRHYVFEVISAAASARRRR